MFISFRQCMCCFREHKNFERFNAVTQSMVLLAVNQLKEISKSVTIPEHAGEDAWTITDWEHLMHLLSKVFLLNFPLYAAYKQSPTKLEEVTQQEAGALSMFCDLHDPEIPAFLLRNVSLFCKSGGPQAMTACFEKKGELPVSLAHSLVAVICNLKLWLNYRSIVQLFVPLRSKVLRYMCGLSDRDLRVPGIKTMAGELFFFFYVCKIIF